MRTIRAFSIIVTSLVFVALSGAGEAHAVSSIGAIGSQQMVRPDEHPTTANHVELRAAKGSFESFQIVVDSGSGGNAINDIDVAITGTPTSGPNSIASSNFTLYRVGYQQVTRPSDAELWGNSDPCPSSCLIPDALIPKVDYIYGETRKAFTSGGFSLSVPAGENRLAWIDLQIPQGQAIGRYTGANVVVTSSGTPIATVPITVEVFNFAMPATSTLRGGFGITPSRVCGTGNSIYTNCANAPGGSGWLMYSLIARTALENRVTLARPALYGPGTNLTAYRTSANDLLDGDATRTPGQKPTDIFLNSAEGANADDWQAEATSPGGTGAPSAYTSKITYYCDEFNSNDTAWQNTCDTNYQTADGLWIGDLPVSLIGRIDHLQWGQQTGNSGAGYTSAHNTANLIPLINRMHDKSGTYTGNQRGNYNAFAATSGKQVWLYNSCMSSGCGSAFTADSYWNGWPSYHTDQPASQARAMAWQVFNYKATGEYYFETLQNISKAWNACGTGGSDCLYNEGGNGDGTLFYPGLTSEIGGTNDIPLESIRLKRIRDGRQDYELLTYLASQCGGACNGVTEQDVRDIAGGPYASPTESGLFGNAYTSNVSQASFDAARADLIDLLPTSGLTCDGKLATILGTGASETITGTAGKDVILGLGGDDTINGLADDDTICGGNGYDTLIGGAGNDHLDGGDGADLVEYTNAPGAMTINLTTGTANGDGNDTITNVSDAYGSWAYNDTITGNANNNYLVGWNGADTIRGLDGNDLIQGLDGNDTLEGGQGNDTLQGGNGTDTITYENAPGAVTVNLATTTSQNTTTAGNDTITGIENLTGSTHADTLSGSATVNTIMGLSGNDYINSHDTSVDTIDCGADADTVDADFLDIIDITCETVNRT